MNNKQKIGFSFSAILVLVALVIPWLLVRLILGIFGILLLVGVTLEIGRDEIINKLKRG